MLKIDSCVCDCGLIVRCDFVAVCCGSLLSVACCLRCSLFAVRRSLCAVCLFWCMSVVVCCLLCSCLL